MRPRTPTPTARRRTTFHLAAALLALLLATAAGLGATFAWSGSAPNAGNEVAAATMGAVPAAAATSNLACSQVTIDWSPAPNAERYRVERSADGGATWTTRAASVTATTYTDAAPTGPASFRWRVRGTRAVGDWTGAAATTTAITCATGYALQATNPPDEVDLTWSSQAGAVGYDIQRRVGGGAWVFLATNRAGTTYTDDEQHTVGETIDYRVRWVNAGGTRDATWSDVATIAAWDGTPVGSGGVSVNRTMSNDWTSGYQANVTVTNTSGAPVTWEILLSLATYPFNGTVTQVNNAQTVSTVGTAWTVKGVSWNQTIAPGQSASFSYQASRGNTPPPTGTATATITVANQWATGYCANVVVTTTSPVPITWQVTKLRATDAPFAATPSLWPVSPSGGIQTASLTGTAWTFTGPSWAATVVAGQTHSLQYCATKS